MSIPTIAIFNSRGGIRKTSLVYHLSWMFSDHGLRVIAADLDPQSNLTAAFLNETRLEELLSGNGYPHTIFGALQPLQRGISDVVNPHVEQVSENLGLLLGDMTLSTFEDHLTEVWPKCLDRDERSFRVTSAFYRIMQRAGHAHQADVILIDLGPNLGAINRAALIASDFVVIPLEPDLFSLHGLQNLGPTLRQWRNGWNERLAGNPVVGLDLPPGSIKPIGYLILCQQIRLDRPLQAVDRWLAQIPSTYAQDVLGQSLDPMVTVDADPHCIGKIKDFRSLIPLVQESRKPMFHLKPADGALGAHMHAVQESFKDFHAVARKIAANAGIKSCS